MEKEKKKLLLHLKPDDSQEEGWYIFKAHSKKRINEVRFSDKSLHFFLSIFILEVKWWEDVMQ